MRKQGLKALLLAVMAVSGLMAFSASAALAVDLNVIMEPSTSIPGIFLINKGATIPTLLTHETAAAAGPGGRLIIPAKSSEIDCTAAKLTGSPFIENEYEDWMIPAMKKGGHGAGDVTFTGCKVFATNSSGVKGAELKACTEVLNKELGTPGEIIASGLIRVVQHPEVVGGVEAKKAFVILEPQINFKKAAEDNILLTSKFTTFTFGGTCSLPSKPEPELHGAIAVRASVTDVNKPEFSVKTWEVSGTTAVLSAEQKLLGAQLTFGANPAFLEANNYKAELTGPNASATWGAM